MSLVPRRIATQFGPTSYYYHRLGVEAGPGLLSVALPEDGAEEVGVGVTQLGADQLVLHLGVDVDEVPGVLPGVLDLYI